MIAGKVLLPESVRTVGNHDGRDTEPLDRFRMPKIETGAKAGLFFQGQLRDKLRDISFHVKPSAAEFTGTEVSMLRRRPSFISISCAIIQINCMIDR
jgi:hypothetical protein